MSKSIGTDTAMQSLHQASVYDTTGGRPITHQASATPVLIVEEPPEDAEIPMLTQQHNCHQPGPRIITEDDRAAANQRRCSLLSLKKKALASAAKATLSASAKTPPGKMCGLFGFDDKTKEKSIIETLSAFPDNNNDDLFGATTTTNCGLNNGGSPLSSLSSTCALSIPTDGRRFPSGAAPCYEESREKSEPPPGDTEAWQVLPDASNNSPVECDCNRNKAPTAQQSEVGPSVSYSSTEEIGWVAISSNVLEEAGRGSRVAGAFVGAAAVGLILGGPVVGVLAGVTIATAAATRTDRAGDAARALGDVAVQAKDRAADLDKQHGILTKSRSATNRVRASVSQGTCDYVWIPALHVITKARNGRVITSNSEGDNDFSRRFGPQLELGAMH